MLRGTTFICTLTFLKWFWNCSPLRHYCNGLYKDTQTSHESIFRKCWLEWSLSWLTACTVLIDTNFLTNKNRDIMRTATNHSGSAWNFNTHCTFWISLYTPPFDLLFVKDIMFMLCEGRVRWKQANTFYLHAHLQVYILSDIGPRILFWGKVALVSTLLKNALSRISHLDGIQLKTQNMLFKYQLSALKYQLWRRFHQIRNQIEAH